MTLRREWRMDEPQRAISALITILTATLLLGCAGVDSESAATVRRSFDPLAATLSSAPDWLRREVSRAGDATRTGESLVRRPDPHQLAFPDLRGSAGLVGKQGRAELQRPAEIMDTAKILVDVPRAEKWRTPMPFDASPSQVMRVEMARWSAAFSTIADLLVREQSRPSRTDFEADTPESPVVNWVRWLWR